MPIDKSKFTFPNRRDICVGLPDGWIAHYAGCFVEAQADGTVVLYSRDTQITYRPGEYLAWFLDDVQVEEPD